MVQGKIRGELIASSAHLSIHKPAGLISVGHDGIFCHDFRL